MEAILAALKTSLPNAKQIVLSPPPLDEEAWQATAKKLTAGRKDGKERSAAKHVEYAKVAGEAAKSSGAAFIDLIYKLKCMQPN